MYKSLEIATSPQSLFIVNIYIVFKMLFNKKYSIFGQRNNNIKLFGAENSKLDARNVKFGARFKLAVHQFHQSHKSTFKTIVFKLVVVI